jgi:23S rRNA pseudouridine1911/1915/1917 synthase
MEPKIIFEDSDVVVLNKPAGLIMHSDGRTEEPSVADWFVARYPEASGVGEVWVSPQGETIARPGIVHRLDRTTSGVVILAKNNEAHAALKEQFQNRSTEKEYRAFVYGHPKDEEGIIEAEITRVRSVPPRWGIQRADESKKHREAITHWRVEKRGVDPTTQEKVALLTALPKTGRTHQIRVHFKHLGNPIVGDHLYAAGKPYLLGFERPALHAFRLSIYLPSGERRAFEAPFPADFEKALQSIAESA